jgi:hypothetical protein
LSRWELAKHGSGRPAGDATLGSGEHIREVVPLQRLLGRPQIPDDRAMDLPGRSRCFSQDQRVALAVRLEVRRRELVPLLPVALREELICRVTDQNVSEHVLLVVTEACGGWRTMTSRWMRP